MRTSLRTFWILVLVLEKTQTRKLRSQRTDRRTSPVCSRVVFSILGTGDVQAETRRRKGMQLHTAGEGGCRSCGAAGVRACSRHCPSVFEWQPWPLEVCMRAKGGYRDMEGGKGRGTEGQERPLGHYEDLYLYSKPEERP